MTSCTQGYKEKHFITDMSCIISNAQVPWPYMTLENDKNALPSGFKADSKHI